MDVKMDLYCTTGRVKGIKERITENSLPLKFSNEENIQIMNHLLQSLVIII
jgi:hypothetical protein